MRNLKAIIGAFFLICGPAWAGQAIRSVRVATGFISPIFLTHVPGDYARLFIVQQNGLIRIRTGNTTLTTPFLNIGSRIIFGGEQGLLGLAFHPNYANNGVFYVYYTASGTGANTLAQFTVSGDPNVANTTGTELFSIPDPFPNHNGGWIAFGPDGYLYIAMGDGGSGNDPNGAGQNINTMLGKMHRIDVDGADGIPANDDDDGILGNGINGYSSPPDNPFFGPTPGLDSIWAYGLRNPWRDSFDRLTGDLYIADVGQNLWEEIDFQSAGSAGGANYGWRCMEGNHCTGLSGCTCNDAALTDPIHEYGHNGVNCSVTGGYVYRGCAIPDLQGVYFFADYCSNSIWSFRYNGAVTEFTDRTAELVPDVGAITDIVSFGEDAYGELYILDLNGEVFKIVPDVLPVDCNGNGLGDACDILSGASSDLNSNGVPDECDLPVPSSPVADPSGINKSRAISFSLPAANVAGRTGQLTAIRVEMTSLHHPVPPYTGGPTSNFSSFEGQYRWVGPPSTYVESSGNPTQFRSSVLQCGPHYRDWTTEGLVHVMGREVVPSSLYTLASVDDFCMGHETSCNVISPGLQVATTRWGDIEIPFNPPSPGTQPDFADVAALVDKFRSTPNAPIKVRAAISGEVPNLSLDVSFDHISACVDAFRGRPYPHAGPTSCP